jgi:small subunit ribosomal protein S9
MVSDSQSLNFGIGRRKTSVAKVILVPGTGLMYINYKPGDFYLQFNATYTNIAKSPLICLGLENIYDMYVTTHGGGIKGQADAIKLGVAKALCYILPDKHSVLKVAGFLTRDARSKERKKYGLRKARKAPQFSKR